MAPNCGHPDHRNTGPGLHRHRPPAGRGGTVRPLLRQAVAALQTDGLVRIEPGRGTFVQHELLDYALSKRTRFSENLLRQGLLPSKQLLTACEITAPERALRELKLEKGAEATISPVLASTDSKVELSPATA